MQSKMDVTEPSMIMSSEGRKEKIKQKKVSKKENGSWATAVNW